MVVWVAQGIGLNKFEFILAFNNCIYYNNILFCEEIKSEFAHKRLKIPIRL